MPGNATLTKTEIAEMMLTEDRPSKLKVQHELKVDNVASREFELIIAYNTFH